MKNSTKKFTNGKIQTQPNYYVAQLHQEVLIIHGHDPPTPTLPGPFVTSPVDMMLKSMDISETKYYLLNLLKIPLMNETVLWGNFIKKCLSSKHGLWKLHRLMVSVDAFREEGTR